MKEVEMKEEVVVEGVEEEEEEEEVEVEEEEDIWSRSFACMLRCQKKDAVANMTTGNIWNLFWVLSHLSVSLFCKLQLHSIRV